MLRHLHGRAISPAGPAGPSDRHPGLGIGRFPDGYYINSVASWGTTINPHVRAFAVNVTATAPTGGGYLTAWDGNEGACPTRRA